MAEGNPLQRQYASRRLLLGTSLLVVGASAADDRLVVDSEYLPSVTGMSTLAEGFRIGGRLIADQLIDNDFDFDYLFVPMLYMYRHALELHLKMVRRAAAEFLGDHLPPERSQGGGPGHRLLKSWKSLAADLHRCGGVEQRVDLESLGDRIGEFDGMDQTGQVLRYPGELTVLNGSISVSTIADVMDVVLEELEGIRTGLEQRRQNRENTPGG